LNRAFSAYSGLQPNTWGVAPGSTLMMRLWRFNANESDVPQFWG
jgi:hypothetical protein